MPTQIFKESKAFETDAWKESMSEYGSILKENKVRQIILVHGTFTGDDVLYFHNLIKPLNEELADRLRQRNKLVIDGLTEDVANYTPNYASSLSAATGIDSEAFVWSSGNFHHARLKGTIKLAQNIAQKIEDKNMQADEAILLMGYSHAGQVFALLTNFLADNELAASLYKIMASSEDFKDDVDDLIHNLKTIKQIRLDFATFGTPIRYVWGEHEKFQLMSVINHRSNVRPSGLLSTRDGDYIQQWGVEGTDMSPANKIEINRVFDAALDKGHDISLLQASLKRKERREPKYASGKPVCENFLIDYRDNARLLEGLSASPVIPHSMKTVFGHGVYTTNKAMLFNLSLIVNNWYN